MRPAAVQSLELKSHWFQILPDPEIAVKLHEYQSKRIFSRHGLPVPQGNVATTPVEARQIANLLGGTVAVKGEWHNIPSARYAPPKGFLGRHHLSVSLA